MLFTRRLFGATAAASTEAGGDRHREGWVIEPVRLGIVARAEELWRYRRLLSFFGIQATKDRYKGTTLGAFWLFARPLMPVALGTFIFGGLLGVPSDGVPYFLFFLTGLSCWRIFERSMRWVTRSLDTQRSLLRRMYFPRLALPIAAAAPAMVEFAILVALLVLASFYFWWNEGVMYLRVGWPMLVALCAVGQSVFLALSAGLFTSVWQTRHKDVHYSQRYFMQFWMYATPVLYPASAIPEQYGFVLYLNPMAPLVETYKWGMLGIGELPFLPLLSGLAMTAIVFAGGLVYFGRSEAASIDRL